MNKEINKLTNVTIISADAMAVLSKEEENYVELWLEVWENRKSLVGIVARLGLDDTGFFSSAKRRYLLWGTPSLLLNVGWR